MLNGQPGSLRAPRGREGVAVGVNAPLECEAPPRPALTDRRDFGGPMDSASNDRARVLARLMSEVVVGYGGSGPGGSECWVWIGYVLNSGYGCVRHAGRRWLTHRLSYAALVGDLGSGLQIDHLCRNTRCVNPSHLELVSQRENILRGTAPSARAAVAVCCPSGHPYAGENLRVRREGAASHRVCITCERARDRRRYARSRLAVARALKGGSA